MTAGEPYGALESTADQTKNVTYRVIETERHVGAPRQSPAECHMVLSTVNVLNKPIHNLLRIYSVLNSDRTQAKPVGTLKQEQILELSRSDRNIWQTYS